MYYTPQQQYGGPRYTHKTRVGNWNEDWEASDTKYVPLKTLANHHYIDSKITLRKKLKLPCFLKRHKKNCPLISNG
jgi:hypothetical protein